ncbi:DUF2235 domain-containing protein [Pseudoalteromonas luteoviolacea]|uniref:T6SS Phospholipase effector Tle1-like catalytic domain-containing protein n=1 Tax=Pseudoalteromonas luteoviolacea S4054 TaxID=1129367 RepID=A0A0F6ADS8_9GAMM|nr:DUF2235 domain-containing protein [Pseudoalteromonas luteoviolacea]AOT08387.1 hypothetical protein S4054249_11255 [Pseudoalteromonas luteoviolacea]AOT13303.1 hypothetical protein S40542_11230 [Pseudoalteromonas luteoviolacea]KKE84335.1 hypothetical protein N479_10580 [Pseudoalteromonas luteoviolacea S4054]KZN76060.1 hypothetical protein N481_06835 [Pseudoalteromonas luteoviolacea S4047-1]
MKRLVLCMDGTWNKPAQYDRGKRKPTNVVKLARGVDPVCPDGVHQVVYYSEGVGTHWGVDKILGGGFGFGLSQNVLRAYQFLVLNYQPGDEIYGFGFSRGAYTIRSVIGLINKIGLLPKDHAFYMPEAYRLYRNTASDSEVEAFKAEHNCTDVSIKFVGVWDTVGALGVPFDFDFINGRYRFHDVSLTENIEHAYHALAIDEKRGPFKPAIWTLPKGSNQTLEQKWFAGSHSNVGGGYSQDGLANISLHWIKDRAKDHGLIFNEKFLSYYRPYHLDEYRDSMSWLYKITERVRKLGIGKHTNESLHESVYKRITDSDNYQPQNAMEFMEKLEEKRIENPN